MLEFLRAFMIQLPIFYVLMVHCVVNTLDIVTHVSNMHRDFPMTPLGSNVNPQAYYQKAMPQKMC